MIITHGLVLNKARVENRLRDINVYRVSANSVQKPLLLNTGSSEQPDLQFVKACFYDRGA